MLTFYYSKNSSALAGHILLEEIGAAYHALEVSIADHEHLTPDYLALNPKGRVPALRDGDRIVTENPAILTYLAERFPDAGMLPTSAGDRARVHEINAYLCATVHVAYAHLHRGARWTDQPAAIDAMNDKVADNLSDAAALIETRYLKGPFALGEHYSIADPYLFLVHRWLAKAGVGLDAFPRLKAHRDVLTQRPATQRALEVHGG